jgi:biopolymer transport protein ExbD
MYDSHLRRARKPAGLLLVPMIDIFTVLVTFLLMTAVFARITVLQLDLPSAAGSSSAEPTFRLEVIVRKEGLELTNGSTRIAALPAINGEYDLKTLSELALSLKREYPDVDNASVLMEPDVKYDSLIQVMDAIRSTEVPAASAGSMLTTQVVAADQQSTDDGGEPKPTRVALFTRIAVGDAP